MENLKDTDIYTKQCSKCHKWYIQWLKEYDKMCSDCFEQDEKSIDKGREEEQTLNMEFTKDEIQTLLTVIGESYPIQRKRNGEWPLEIHQAIKDLREKLLDEFLKL